MTTNDRQAEKAARHKRDLAAAAASVHGFNDREDRAPYPVRMGPQSEDFRMLVESGWKVATIRGGGHNSELIRYNPTTHRLVLAKERFGRSGADLGEQASPPEVEVVENPDGAVLTAEERLDYDLVLAYLLVPEIREMKRYEWRPVETSAA